MFGPIPSMPGYLEGPSDASAVYTSVTDMSMLVIAAACVALSTMGES